MAGNKFSIETISGYFILQWGWKRGLSAFVFGALSALAMPPFDQFWVLFITLPVLVWLIDSTAADPGRGLISRLRPSFFTGWWFAFGYFLAGLWWIGSALLVDAERFAWMMPFAILGIPALLALFWAVAVSAARIMWSDDWRRIVMLAVFLSLGEYLRGTILTGFPWNILGYAAMTNPVMMQSASILGLYGITPLAILVFASPAIFAPGSGGRPRRVRLLMIFCLLATTVHIGFGMWRLQQNPVQVVDGVNLRIIQPAIAQKDKWLPENENKIFSSYLALSNSGEGNITHFIWPESAFPFILTQRRDALAAIAAMLPLDAYLITGAMRVEMSAEKASTPKVFNSVFVINHQGEIVGAADKAHLVPFGEYLPFQKYAERIGLQQLTGIDNGFTPATDRQILTTKSAGNFLPLICYEISFPGQIRPKSQFRISGKNKPPVEPSWIVNVTNDAWFGNTPGPYQHHRQAVVRGVEEGLPVIRAANSGISSVSDAFGRIQAVLALGQRGSLDAGLPPPVVTYFRSYANMGFFMICAGLFLFSAWRRKH